MDAARNFRLALRTLARSPLFTAVAVLTLAVGIGANTAIFSVLNGVLLKPLGFDDPDRLVGVWHKAPGLGWDAVNQSPALYFAYREGSQVFADSGMWDNDQVSVTEIGEPEEVAAMRVTDGTLPLLGVQPFLGRLFTRDDDTPGTPETVILSYGYWQDRFGGDRDVLGRVVKVNGRPHEVVGVLPRDLHFLDFDPALYLPFRFDRGEVFFGNFSYQGVARLKPGFTIAQANAELERLIPVALDTFPPPEGFTREMIKEMGFGPNVRPLEVDVVGDVGGVLWMLLGAGGLVLLVAALNVANLMLVRAESQQQEVAIKSALGAGRRRIGGALFLESLLLALFGGVLGLGLAWAGVRLLVAMAPLGLPRLDEIAIDPVVLLFTLTASVVAAFAFGLFPLLRLRSLDLAGALKEGGRGSSSGRQRNRARNVLVTAQIAVALVLLVGSGLMVRSLLALRDVNPGFERPEEVLTLRLAIPEAKVEDPAEVALLHERILSRLASLPGVSSAGLTTSVTLDRWDSNDPIFVEDFPVPADQLPQLRRFKWIAPGFFETLENPLVAGRGITWDDVHERRPVVVVSETLAAEYWDEPAQALGRRIKAYPEQAWREIVGVVAKEYDDGVERGPTAVAYWPMATVDFFEDGLFVPRSMAYVLRSPRVGQASFLDEVRSAVWSIDPNLPLANVCTLAELFDRSLARTSFTLVMLGIAALAALLLGAIGIYGVTSYAVAQRTREIGVRMAFGAAPGDVSRLMLRHGATLAAFGVVAGLLGALALTRLMSALLYGISPLDPLSFAAGSLGVVAVALFASYLPARRAAGVDPIDTLRCE